MEDILGSVYKRSSEHAVQLQGIVFWKRVLTFVLVDFAWLFFRARNLTDALHKMAADDYSDLLNDDQQVMTGFRVLTNKLHDGDDIITKLNQHADQWVAQHGEEV